MFKTLIATVVTALTLTASAVGAPPSMNEDGGSGGNNGPYYTWVEVSITYDHTGYPIFRYCEYGAFNFGTIQLRCWS